MYLAQPGLWYDLHESKHFQRREPFQPFFSSTGCRRRLGHFINIGPEARHARCCKPNRLADQGNGAPDSPVDVALQPTAHWLSRKQMPRDDDQKANIGTWVETTGKRNEKGFTLSRTPADSHSNHQLAAQRRPADRSPRNSVLG